MCLKKLLKKININFKNIDLYIKSLTHSTFSHESTKKIENYESLEFLGDSLINFIITEYVFKNTNDLVGKQSPIKNYLISNEILFKTTINLGLIKYLKIGKSLINVDLIKEKSKILADIFESFVAAIFLDLNDFEFTKKFVIHYLIKPNWNISLQNNDYKTLLQEIIQFEMKKLKGDLYVISEKNQNFYVICKYKNFKTKSVNQNKKLATKEAARLMLIKIGKI